MAHRVFSLSGTSVGPEQVPALLGSVRELIAILSARMACSNSQPRGLPASLGHRAEDLVGRPFTSLTHANDHRWRARVPP